MDSISQREGDERGPDGGRIGLASYEPAGRTRAGSLTVVAEKKLERGVLLTFDADGRREHAFSYYDTAEVDSSSKVLRARKLQGGGSSWAGIVHGLLAIRAPEVMARSSWIRRATG